MRWVSKPRPFGIALLLPALAAVPASGASELFVVRHARIVVGTGQVIENGSIVIENGLVAAVGRDQEIPAPPDAWVIQATGKTVYPGFVDALGDLGLGGSGKGNDGEAEADRSRPEDEETIARGPGDRPGTTSWRAAADELSLADGRIANWRKAGFTSAVTVFDEGIFPGQAAFIDLAGERAREMVVRTPLALRLNFSPPGSRRSFPASLMGVLAYVKQAFADADHYRESWTAYEREPRGKTRPSYDRALVPLARARTENWPVLLPAEWAHEIERSIHLAREIGVNPILYGLHQGYAAADVLAREKIPVLVSLKWPRRDPEADPEAEEPLRVLEMRDRAPSTPAALEKAGVRFGFFSDGLKKPEEILAGVRKAIDAGLTREGAVRALSLDAASIFGLEDRLGSLEKGKIANLFVAGGDIFDPETRVETVFVDGKVFENRESADEDDRKGGVR